VSNIRPTSVRVLGIDIRIEYVDKDIIGDDLQGTYDPDQLLIQVKEGMDPGNTRLVIWHEICHIIESLASISMTESAICIYSTGFIQIMLDNEDFAKWSFPMSNG